MGCDAGFFFFFFWQVGNEVSEESVPLILIQGDDRICHGTLKLEAKACPETIVKCIRRPAKLKVSQS